MREQFVFVFILSITKINVDAGDFRPPAVPLLVFSPHISGESLNAISNKRKQKNNYAELLKLK